MSQDTITISNSDLKTVLKELRIMAGAIPASVLADLNREGKVDAPRFMRALHNAAKVLGEPEPKVRRCRAYVLKIEQRDTKSAIINEMYHGRLVEVTDDGINVIVEKLAGAHTAMSVGGSEIVENGNGTFTVRGKYEWTFTYASEWK